MTRYLSDNSLRLSSNKPPQTFNGDLHNLPSALDELKLKLNWVLWKWHWKKGRWQKPPYQLNGKCAKVDDPTTWSSYAEVMAAYATGKYDGIGFNLLDSSFGAFDLDDCRDVATEEIEGAAKEIMARVGSYQEVSPSGTGIRIIGSAVGAKHQSKVDKVEAYRNAARYITITGNALNGCGCLNNIDAAIDAAASDQDKDHPSPKFKCISAEELMQKQFAPIKWILPNFITEGCILFVGRPKIGKSWLALQIGMATSAGDMTLGEQCESGDVLYCALEDNERRLQFRLGGLQGAGAKVDLSHITFATEMPRIDDGAIGYLKEWVARVDNPRLIIIDCLEKVRAPVTAKQTAYTNDYTALEQFRTFANKHHVAVVVVHHDRKLDAADPFDTVSGTLGLNGAADTVIVIKKEGAGAILHATGRDIPSVERAIEPRSTNGEVMWQMLGDAVKLRINNQRSKIMEALTTTPQSPQQIAKATGMKYDNVKKLLHRMYLDATIKKEGRGRYYLEAGAWQ